METFNFSVPQDITVGKGSLSKLPEIAKKLGGKHALIISGPHLEKMGLVKKAADYLTSVDIEADTFTDIEANPSVTTVEKATAKYLEPSAHHASTMPHSWVISDPPLPGMQYIATMKPDMMTAIVPKNLYAGTL